MKCPKNGKTRSFQLPQSALLALSFQRDQQQEHRRLFGADYKNLDLFFCEPDGNYHQPDLVSQVIIRRIRKAGIKNGSFHTLRHYAGLRTIPGGLVFRPLGGSLVNVFPA